MLASFRVPAAFIARRAATMTTSPPLLSPAPGPSASFPLRTNVWKGLSASNTVSRCAMSNSFLVPFLPVWDATRCPARVAADMSIHSTVKPSGSSSARIISATDLMPAKLTVPLLTPTISPSNVIERSNS